MTGGLDECQKVVPRGKVFNANAKDHLLYPVFKILHWKHPDKVKEWESTLSQNIHGHMGAVSLSRARWNVSEIVIVGALTPASAVKHAGLEEPWTVEEVDWVKEKQRFELEESHIVRLGLWPEQMMEALSI